MLRLVLCALVAAATAHRVRRIVGGYEAAPPLPQNVADMYREGAPPPPPPPPEVEPQPTFDMPPKPNIEVKGTRNSDGHHCFLGIPYAIPPVGKLRFQRTRRRYMEGFVNATRYAPPCPQIDKDTQQVVGDEDCLYLNVYTQPAENRNGLMPVLLWIHGGHYARGAGNQYDPRKLVSRGIVVVTFQYRLGTLGFLSLNSEELMGNNGLFDCTAALRWVERYIQSFGGDPKRVTVAGQGNGASIATFLAVNKFSTDIVKGVVAMSGTALSPFSVDKNETSSATSVSEASGGTCKISGPRIDYIKCMQNLPVDKIIRGEFEVAKKKRKDYGVAGVSSLLVPAVAEDKPNDDRFLPSFLEGSPINIMNNAKLKHPIPMLTGVTKQETAGAMKGSFFSQLKQLPQQLLSNSLFKDLHLANTGLFQNKSADPLLTTLFSKSTYTAFFNVLSQKARDQLSQLVKATTDAFFNLPVFVTSHIWSKKSPIYLYSFEQKIVHSSSNKFLKDLALAESTTQDAHHGDDLIYIFEPQTLYGEPIPGEIMSEEDFMISQYMVNSISSFVFDGKPTIKEGVVWSPFSPERNNYMIISPNPRETENFHKCDMGLWSADSSILKSKECSAQLPGVNDVINSVPGVRSLLNYGNSSFLQLKQTVENVGKPLTDTISKVGSMTQPLTNPLGSLPKVRSPFG